MGNDKRVEGIWRDEGLKVPARQLKQGILWLADGSCIRLRASGPTMCSPATSSRTKPARTRLRSFIFKEMVCLS